MQPIDEARHAPPGGCASSTSTKSPKSSWTESWYFDFATPEGVGGYVHLALYPMQSRAWYWACLVRPESGPVVIRDHDLAPPRGRLLEIRGDGIWAECVCETPFEHWSLGLEAFGVRLDDPSDAWRGELGERLPVGHDLSWEATGRAHEPQQARCEGRGYVQPGRVRGEVLLARERITIDGTGHRSHSWGPFDWRRGGWEWSGVCTDDGGAVSVTALDDGGAHGARWLPDATVVDIAAARRADGRLTIDELTFDIDVLGEAPLAFEPPEVDPSSSGRLWRALCRFQGAQTTGTGWSARIVPTTEEQG